MSEVDRPLRPEANRLDALEPRDLAQLRDALSELRSNLRSRSRADAAVTDTSIDWMALFDEARRILGQLGMHDRSPDFDEFGADLAGIERLRPFVDFLYDRYWRIETRGVANLPTEGPCILVANRSGLLPWDALMLSRCVERWHPSIGRPRFLVDDWLLGLPFAQANLSRLGGIRACPANLDRLLEAGHSVVVFPEGEKGASKPYADRYRLARFARGGVIRAALANGVPLVPIGVVGAEEAHPVLFKSQLLGQLLGVPSVPVTPTFPLLGPLGLLPLPSRWLISIGRGLPLADVDSVGARDEVLLSRLNGVLRSQVQDLVDQGLELRRTD